MAVAYSQQVSTSSVSASTVNIGPVTPSGDERLLIATCAPADAGGAPGVSLDEVEHSDRTVSSNGGSIFDSTQFGSYYRVHMQYILQPDADSDDVTFTMNEAPDHGGLGASFFTGVHQTTPLGSVVTKGPSTDDNPTVTVTDGATGDMVVDCIGGNGATMTVAGGGTLIYKFENISSYMGIGHAYEAGAASVERSWTWTDADYYFGAVNIFAAPTFSHEQEGARWRDDDADEDEAAWLAAQDANITRATATNTRVRFLKNSTGDPPSEQDKIQERKVGDPASEWRDIS